MVFIQHTEHKGIAQVSDRAFRVYERLGWKQIVPPAKNARAQEWKDYALLIDEGNRKRIEEATKAELIDRYGTEEPAVTTEAERVPAGPSEENSDD